MYNNNFDGNAIHALFPFFPEITELVHRTYGTRYII